MKKIYILAAMVAFAFTTNAQIVEDDFEFYTIGEVGAQNPAVWSTWSGVPDNPGESLLIQDSQVSEGDQGGFIDGNTTRDVILVLGNQTSGQYTLQFNALIPAGKGGYFNIQGETEDPGTGFQGAGNGGMGVFNSGNITFNDPAGAGPGIVVDAANGEELEYPEGEFFTISIFFDIDALEYTMTVDGNSAAAPVAFQADTTLGGIDFFSIDANNEFYFDEVLFVEGLILANDEFSATNFSVYPNPVQDRLNIQSTNTVDAVVVYDVLGKVVLSTTPGAVSPSIDMSNLSSGAYLVNITINGASKTVKVIK